MHLHNINKVLSITDYKYLVLLLQVVESYTIGREQFGMEKEFIVEVVQNCPNPACRYYKNQLEMTQKSIQQHLSQQPTYIPGKLGCLFSITIII